MSMRLRERGKELVFTSNADEEAGALFGRSRFLKMVGGALFGTAAVLAVDATPAFAAACNTSAPGNGCWGFKRCNCCSGTSCCAPSCVAHFGYCPATQDGYPAGGNYWSACVNGYLYNCADFCQNCSYPCPTANDGCPSQRCACICRFYVGRC